MDKSTITWIILLLWFSYPIIKIIVNSIKKNKHKKFMKKVKRMKTKTKTKTIISIAIAAAVIAIGIITDTMDGLFCMLGIGVIGFWIWIMFEYRD